MVQSFEWTSLLLYCHIKDPESTDGWILLSEYQPKPCWEVPSLPNQSIQDSSGSEVKVTRQKAVITVIGTQYYSYERTDNSSWVFPQGVLPHSLVYYRWRWPSVYTWAKGQLPSKSLVIFSTVQSQEIYQGRVRMSMQNVCSRLEAPGNFILNRQGSIQVLNDLAWLEGMGSDAIHKVNI